MIGMLICCGLVAPSPDAIAAASDDGLQETLAANALMLQTRMREKQALEQDLAKLEHEYADVRSRYAQQNQTLQILLIAVQKLARTPPETILSHPDKPRQVIHSAIILRNIIATLQSRIRPLQADIDHYQTLAGKITERKATLTLVEADLRQQDTALQDMINLRMKSRTPPRIAPSQSQTLAQTLAPSTVPVQETSDPADLIVPDQQSATPPDLPPPQWIAPLTGDIIPPPENMPHDINGVWLAGDAGNIILCPASGIIRYIGPFRGYGQMIIIEHGGGYHSVLAGLAETDTIMVDHHQYVLGGEPLARIGQTPENSPATGKGVAAMPPAATFHTGGDGKRHPIYFEVRYHGKSDMPDRLASLLKKKDSVQ